MLFLFLNWICCFQQPVSSLTRVKIGISEMHKHLF